MVFQGSKNKLAKYIAPIIQKIINDNNVDKYIEPFVGGANIIDKIRCNNKIGMDINDDLIALLTYARDNPNLDIAPDSCSFEHYKDVRADKNHKVYSKEYRALIGYMASYGGRYFDGGYGKDRKGSRNIYKERVKNFKKQAALLKDINFQCDDYKNINPDEYVNCVFYMDPPYKDTKQYAKQQIDYNYFYSLCRRLSENNIVLISEYNMPDDFVCVWAKDRKVLQESDRIVGKDVVEKLWVHKIQYERNDMIDTN